MDKEYRTILPGGLVINGNLEKEARFKALNGHLELRLAESVSFTEDIPGQVTDILYSALDTIGNTRVDKKMVTGLCVPDRQYLMMRLASIFSGDHFWINGYCEKCKNPFDVGLIRSDLPVKNCEDDFPQFSFYSSNKKFEIKIPTGGDQDKITGLDDVEALRKLLGLCIISIDDKQPEKGFTDFLTVDDMENIDLKLDQISPSVTSSIRTSCPECGLEHDLNLDPYALPGNGMPILEEIHMLAWFYNWSEKEILDLSRQRRRLYLKFIDNARGLVS